MATELGQRSAWGRFTMRTDAWWVQPLLVILGLGSFGVYSLWRVFENAYYNVGPYASPFGSPDLRGFVPGLASLPFPVSPALLILPFPLGFRLTCYYYRKGYYRSFFLSPPACAVRGASSKAYVGERTIFVLQNLHRFFLYAALVILAILWWDALQAFGVGSGHVFVSWVSLVFLLNVVLLSAYTLGCHSLRHLSGGRLDCFSCDAASRARYGVWRKVSALNERHMLWAWASLFSVWAVDLVVRSLAVGWLRDVRLVA
jgi:hypothetical protein